MKELQDFKNQFKYLKAREYPGVGPERYGHLKDFIGDILKERTWCFPFLHDWGKWETVWLKIDIEPTCIPLHTKTCKRCKKEQNRLLTKKP